MHLTLGVPPAGPKLTGRRYPVTFSNLVAHALWRWRRHQPFLHPALLQAAGKPHAPKPDGGPQGDAVQSQRVSALPIHTPGLTLGVTHHGGGGHLLWEEGEEEERDAQPLFNHITVAPPASQGSPWAESFVVLHYSRGLEEISGNVFTPVCEFIQPLL